ncbi:MAG: ABC transporter permease subunit [Microthrixaceae bacterium]
MLLGPALVAVVVALLPLWYLFDQALGQGLAEVWADLWTSSTAGLLWRSLGLAAVVTSLCVVLGTGAAVMVVRTDVPFARSLEVLLALPLAVPSFVAAFSWVSWFRWLAGFWGAVLVLTLVSYPFVYLPAVAALRRLDPAQEEVALSLGRSRTGVLAAVTIPQLRPAVAAGGLLVALYVLSDFGAVGTMRYEAFTWVIYGAFRAGFDPGRAAVLSSLLVVVALLIVWAESVVRGRPGFARLGRERRDRRSGSRSAEPAGPPWHRWRSCWAARSPSPCSASSSGSAGGSRPGWTGRGCAPAARACCWPARGPSRRCSWRCRWEYSLRATVTFPPGSSNAPCTSRMPCRGSSWR